MTEIEIMQLISTLTLEEKVSLLSGKDTWQTQDITAKGIERIWLSDGPHGLRKEAPHLAKENGGHSVRATCFPTASTLACSWDTQLLSDVGTAIAEECKANDVSVILGPGVNIKRSPMCGRNFEYFSEDPLLAGTLAASMIKGSENNGVGTSIKHFAANNQETLRMSISSEIDERALNEVYLKPFEIAVKNGKPSTVMCSYNRVNGVYASENKQLLTDTLRTKWGFDGAVMSDWGAVSNRALGIEAGLDLEMPSSSGYHDAAVINAVKSGALNEKDIDKACANVLKLVDKLKCDKSADKQCDMQAHHALAVKALCKSAVLMKNENDVLPLKKADNIVFIGAMAGEQGRYQGCGSSIVNPANKVDFATAYKLKTVSDFIYAKGYKTENVNVDKELEAAAVFHAGNAEKAVIFVGLTESYETECCDRETMQLPLNQQHLIEAVSAVNNNVVVVLISGSAVTMPWIDSVKGVLYAALGGEGMGEAIYDVLYGNVNPSGKLAETWPLSFEDTPCANYWPMGPRLVTYNESIYVGYRYYDTAQKSVLFPFGHGLSYTQFKYDGMTLSSESLKEGETLTANITLTNNGDKDGEEVVQIYVSHIDSAAYQPAHELKAFARVSLKAGETKTISVEIPYENFTFYDVQRHDFVVETGSYIIGAGASSANIPLLQNIHVEGKKVTLPQAFSRNGAYGAVADNSFADDAFYAIHTRSKQQNTIPPKGAFTLTTPLGQVAQASRFAHIICIFSKKFAAKYMHFSTDESVNKKAVIYCVDYLPFKNIGMQSAGSISAEMVKTMLDICNGQSKMIDLWHVWRHNKK